MPAPSFDWLTGQAARSPVRCRELKRDRHAARHLAGRASARRARLRARGHAERDLRGRQRRHARAHRSRDRPRRCGASAPASAVGAAPARTTTLVVVGTDKGDVLAFDADGKPQWTARVSSEVIAPPRGRRRGRRRARPATAASTGSPPPTARRSGCTSARNPPLTVRNYAGGVATRGGVFVGTAGGRLLALDIADRHVGWDGDGRHAEGRDRARAHRRRHEPAARRRERQVCAVAYQGRVACFDIMRGTLNWSRDVSSLDRPRRRRARISTSPTTRARCTRSTRAPAHRCGSRTSSPSARSAARRSIGEHVARRRRRGLRAPARATDGAYVGRLATDGSRARPSQPQRCSPAEHAVWQSDRTGNASTPVAVAT